MWKTGFSPDGAVDCLFAVNLKNASCLWVEPVEAIDDGGKTRTYWHIKAVVEIFDNFDENPKKVTVYLKELKSRAAANQHLASLVSALNEEEKACVEN